MTQNTLTRSETMNEAQLTALRAINETLTAADNKADETRAAIMEYMHYAGANFWRLNEGQWQGLYFLADGFGQIDRAFAHEQCWDWSHVRDSSPEAFDHIWDAICHWHNTGQLKTA